MVRYGRNMIWGSVLLAGTVSAAPPAGPADTEARLQRLERLQENQNLVDMATRLDQLQRELQGLRGQLEEQAHVLDGIKRRQRELYLDTDRRLSRLEREGGAPAAGSPGMVTAPVPVPGPEAAAPVPPAVQPVEAQGGQAPAAQTAAPAAGAQAPVVDTAAEMQAYQHAFDLLRELRYQQAIAAFRTFLQNYPDGRYAHIAQYWLGEANYAQRHFEQAIKDYRALIANYPKSPKLAEATLKIGYSYYELGNKDAARQTLDELLKRYPNTTEAGQARHLLQRLKQEG